MGGIIRVFEFAEDSGWASSQAMGMVRSWRHINRTTGVSSGDIEGRVYTSDVAAGRQVESKGRSTDQNE